MVAEQVPSLPSPEIFLSGALLFVELFEKLSSVTTRVFRLSSYIPIAAMDSQILEEAREDKKVRSSYEHDGEVGHAVPRETNTRNALARVLQYTSYCSAMVFSGRRVCMSPVDRLSCRQRGVRCRRGHAGTVVTRYVENSWRHARFRLVCRRDSNTVVASHRSVVRIIILILSPDSGIILAARLTTRLIIH